MSMEPLDAGEVNPGRLDDITGGDPDLKEELIGIFLEDTAQRLASLGQAVDAGDAKAVREAAHTIKGSSGNMGATGMQHVAEHLERMAKEGDLSGAARSLDGLQTGFAAVRQFFLKTAG
jgi:HPt (histidine-containing phosphotransfer) domain-containing protein